MIDAANDTQPLEDGAPNASGETAMDEEVVHGLRTLFTKRAQPQFGHPRFAKRSAVHTLFWFASQAKNFIFGGAHIFQIVL
jgi:hypothetical protein